VGYDIFRGSASILTKHPFCCIFYCRTLKRIVFESGAMRPINLLLRAVFKQINQQHPKEDGFMMTNSSRIVQPESRLVHGVFNPPIIVFDGFKALMDEKKINFRQFSWIGSKTPPEFDPDEHRVVVALSPTFATLEQTFDLGAEWMLAGQEWSRRYPGPYSDPKHLALLPGTRFRPDTLEWVKINLGTHIGRKPIDVRRPNFSPGCALLWMAAEHPALIRAIDYRKYFGFWLGGLVCTAHHRNPFAHVPCVSFNRRVRISSFPADDCYGGLAVPTYVDPPR
jgi:hypothetical protein